MNASKIIDSLDGFVDVLPALLAATDGADATWRPADGGWSILDILGHLAHEEVMDFRPRLESLLGDASRPWVPIDPERRADEARASLASIADECERFVAARRESITWLRGLEGERDGADWTLVYEHPQLGPLRAGDLLLSWSAHDVLHARQLMRRQYELLHVHAPDHASGYAGPFG